MKRSTLTHLLTTVAVCLLAVALGAALKCRPRTVPLEECSEVYRQYCDTPGIRAAFIKDKQINDTLRLDMTLLQADDSATFVWLLKKWGKSDELIEELLSFDNDEKTRFVKRIPKGHPELPRDKDDTNNEVIATFPVLKSVAIFHTQTQEQIKVVLHANYFKEIEL